MLPFFFFFQTLTELGSCLPCPSHSPAEKFYTQAHPYAVQLTQVRVNHDFKSPIYWYTLEQSSLYIFFQESCPDTSDEFFISE